MSILYITHDGITDHIGQSQVAPYLLGLAERGYRITLLSAEKRGRDSLVERYQGVFESAGIEWISIPYRNRPQLLGQGLTFARLWREAARIVRARQVRVVHCRSVVPTIIGRLLKSTHGTKYIFDFRDFYADGGMDTKRFKLVYRVLKWMERGLVVNAGKVSCLTRRATEVLGDWYLTDDPRRNAHFSVVPCCADFEHFSPAKVDPGSLRSMRGRLGIDRDAYVLLYLGSLGPDYLLREMVALFRNTLSVHDNAYFLFIANNGEELVRREFEAQGVPSFRLRFSSLERDDVPTAIALADLSVVFIRPSLSKAGCSPTKLAELFAMGVPVIANRGVGDMDSILDPHRNGSVLVGDFEDQTLVAAVSTVDSAKSAGVDIRGNSMMFSLNEGVRLYAGVYRDFVSEESI